MVLAWLKSDVPMSSHVPAVSWSERRVVLDVPTETSVDELVCLYPSVVQSILCVFNCYNGSIRSFIIDMAKAVTLKNNNNEEVYPVTDLSLVNGDIPTGRIADNAITTAKIANNAITSDKIDWTTLPYKYAATLSTQNISSTEPTQLTGISFTIDTAGLYMIALTGNYQAYGTPGSYPRFGVYVGADRKFYSAVSTLAGLQNNFATIGILNLNAGDVVRGMVTGGACQVFEGCRMVAIRVG